MSRTAALAAFVITLIAGCAWPPGMPSGPGVPAPDQAAEQAVGTVDQAAAGVAETTTGVTRSVSQIRTPSTSVPRLGAVGLGGGRVGGGLIGR